MIIFELISVIFDKLLSFFFISLFIILPIIFVWSYWYEIIKAYPTFFSILGLFIAYKLFMFIKKA